MAAAGLECLTSELFEMIVQRLDLSNVRNLRLVCRNVAFKATQDTYRQFFRVKHVDLTRPGLETFAQLTSSGGLGCLVEHLTLVGIVYNPTLLENVVKSGKKSVLREGSSSYMVSRSCSEEELKQARNDLETMRRRQADLDELRQQRVDVSLLKTALCNLAANINHTPLKSLSLQIAVYRENTKIKLSPSDGKCWKSVFEATARSFVLAMSCLRDSKLPVEGLDIFAKKPESLCCSLPCDTLNQLEWAVGFGPSFTTLKSLSISISDPIADESEYHARKSGDPAQKVPFELIKQKRDRETLRALILDEGNVSGLCEMLSVCHHLEELELSAYALERSDSELEDLQETMRRRYMDNLANHMMPLVQLRKLRIGGLSASQEDLLAFLRNHSSSLRGLELSSISIDRGSFAPVMLCIRDMNLESIQLEDLWENGDLVLLNDEMESEYTKIGGDYLGQNVINITGADTSNKIAYSPYRGPAVGSPKVRRWQQRKKMDFGRL
ncbi:hypothetical protein M409DRAFT_54245 [Zasmidium cellare ATCC 36951]|uniref:Uncharacterized protein n=1 Tax=Zasmidium cellare ATCC 36951 TaxID=1080233 RepID=A0A6A6CLJ5_ZASCE|nr:uncharacterized protein M409DRAFT_54245 [Zasmidium cellare ATCC 36951]KAF2167030.1 hypothetical protein M409DRAFT_54245 [Zasmidium cellare ATCC 36951]